MSFAHPNVIQSPSLWMLRSPPLMSRQDHHFHQGNIEYHEASRNALHNGGASTLNYKLSSKSNNRYPIRNVFDYPSVSAFNLQSRALVNLKNANNFGFLSFNNHSRNNKYKFGQHLNALTYNTVHPHRTFNRKTSDNVIYDAAAEEYEDLDYYERPPPERLQFVHSNLKANLPHYQCSSTSTTTTESVSTVAADSDTLQSTIKTSKTLLAPPTNPQLLTSVISLKPQNHFDENDLITKRKIKTSEKFLHESVKYNKPLKTKKTNNSSCCSNRGKKVCLIVIFILLASILFALGGATFGYVMYVKNGNLTSSTIYEFLHNTSQFFQLINISEENNNTHLENNEDNQILTTIKFSYDEDMNRFSPNGNFFLKPFQAKKKENNKIEEGEKLNLETKFGKDDPLIQPKNLLILQTTKQKICLFEVGTSEQEQSRQDFRIAHIPGARLLFYASLSHNGVPVHPLQFQRYIRSLGVDSNCHVIVYDRGEQVWATYAFWIFKLYGHSKISLLNGGFEAWNRLSQLVLKHNKPAEENLFFQNESGSGTFAEKPGNFRAAWNSEIIVTFDDVFANFDATNKPMAEIIDTQTPEEYNGKIMGNNRRNDAVIFGHIRGAINIPSEQLYDWKNYTWAPKNAISQIFRDKKGLTDRTRSIILYDGTSLRSAMVWFSLHRLNYSCISIYFGAWPEWIIRAPDYLKVIPNGE